MLEAFTDIKFSAATLGTIDAANRIIADYQAQGFTLTLRQLYYQFVARDLITNTTQSYKRLGSIIADARLAGMVDWEAIEDRTRNLLELPTWGSPSDLLRESAEQYLTDKWADQPRRVEVWIEKEALVGVIQRVCWDYNVPYFACRGYSSLTEQYKAGQRFENYFLNASQDVIVLHLGDHDPSGLDMTRDNADRLDSLSHQTPVEVRRLALNMDQVLQYNPPFNPAKLTDSRASGYIRKYGDKSWELDALEPNVIDTLIRNEIEKILDRAAWDASLAREQEQRSKLRTLADEWTD